MSNARSSKTYEVVTAERVMTGQIMEDGDKVTVYTPGPGRKPTVLRSAILRMAVLEQPSVKVKPKEAKAARKAERKTRATAVKSVREPVRSVDHPRPGQRTVHALAQ